MVYRPWLPTRHNRNEVQRIRSTFSRRDLRRGLEAHMRRAQQVSTWHSNLERV